MKYYKVNIITSHFNKLNFIYPQKAPGFPSPNYPTLYHYSDLQHNRLFGF